MSNGLSVSIGIVLVNYNGSTHTLNLLHSLAGAVHSDHWIIRVVVVDNGSSIEDRDTLRRSIHDATDPSLSVQLIEQENLGFAAGVNRGLRELQCAAVDWFWILNNDTILDEQCIKKLVDAAEAAHGPALFGSTLIYLDDRKTVQAAGGALYFKPLALGKHLLKGRSIDQCASAEIGKLDYVVGASIFLSSETLALLGLLPEEYFLYYEETEWCLRAARKGVPLVWVRDSVVYHAEGAATGAEDKFRRLSDQVAYFLWRNSLWMTKKLWAYWLPCVLMTKTLELGIALAKGDRRKLKVFRHAVGDFLAGRMGPAPKDLGT